MTVGKNKHIFSRCSVQWIKFYMCPLLHGGAWRGGGGSIVEQYLS